MDVETLAVSKIATMVGRCIHLRSYIATNDKTPFTDGYIDVYNGGKQNKSGWRGRVQIQVKGRTLKVKRGASMNYRIDRTDLLAYQKDSGVLYFVVAVDSKTGRTKPFYKLLSPFAIEAILLDAPEDKAQISVSLDRLPDNPAGIERVVSLALKTQDQNMELGFDPVLFKQMESMTVYTAFGVDLTEPVVLTPGVNDFALVLNTTGGMSVPLAGELHIFPPGYTPRTIELHIRSGEITYETVTVQRVDNVTVEVTLAESLKLFLTLRNNAVSIHVSLTLADTLTERLRAVEFFTALLDEETLEIGGVASRADITSMPADAGLRNHLRMLRELSALFDYLGADSNLIDLTTLDEAELEQLRILHGAFVLGEEVTGADAQAGRALQPVGPWNVMFLVVAGSTPGKWQLVDPFAPTVRKQFRMYSVDDEEFDPIPATAYDAIEPADIGTILNLRLDQIVEAYEALGDIPSTYGLANQRVLALITAADNHPVRRDELLSAAEVLNEWLMKRRGEEPPDLVNRYQITARRDSLSTAERTIIRQLRRDVSASGESSAAQLQLACSLLLDDQDEVTDLLQQMPAEQIRQLQSWPIWTLRGGA